MMARQGWLQRQLDSLEYWAEVAEAERLEFEQWTPPPDPSRAQPVEDIRAKPTGCVDAEMRDTGEILYVDLPADYYCYYGLDPLPARSPNHPLAFSPDRPMFSTEELVCSVCGDTWTREVKPGRKPRKCGHCIEELTCDICGDTWERRVKPGRKPQQCPTCRYDSEYEAYETLTCSDCGDSWDRRMKPGPKPHRCPDCDKPPSPRQPDYTRWDDEHDLIECTKCGDLWLRERKRGLKPLSCPEC